MNYLKSATFWHYALVAALIFVGVFLRVYNHGEYIHFELDQARDAYVIWDSLAADQWPEKGLIARGSDLHLGPAFYWFGIVSAQMFGFSVESIAYVDLLFGVLALALTYVLVRRIFILLWRLGCLLW